MEVGDILYLGFPGATAPTKFMPASVALSDGRRLIVRLTARVPVEAGTVVTVYYFDQTHKFLRADSQVRAVLPSVPFLSVELMLSGEAAPANARETFRVRAAAAGVVAFINATSADGVHDISSEGLSVVTGLQLKIGATVEIKLGYGGKSYAGRARIANATSLDGGKVRYGLQCQGGAAGSQSWTRDIAGLIQREQLQRRSTLK